MAAGGCAERNSALCDARHCGAQEKDWPASTSPSCVVPCQAMACSGLLLQTPHTLLGAEGAPSSGAPRVRRTRQVTWLQLPNIFVLPRSIELLRSLADARVLVQALTNPASPPLRARPVDLEHHSNQAYRLLHREHRSSLLSRSSRLERALWPRSTPFGVLTE